LGKKKEERNIAGEEVHGEKKRGQKWNVMLRDDPMDPFDMY